MDVGVIMKDITQLTVWDQTFGVSISSALPSWFYEIVTSLIPNLLIIIGTIIF